MTRHLPAHTAWVIALAMVFCPEGGSAALLELDRGAFNSARSGLPLFVEDFEGLAGSLYPAPLTLSNGLSYAAPSPAILTGTGKQLTEGSSQLTAARMFSNFAATASLFGIDLQLEDGDEYDVVVETVGGDRLELLGERGNAFNGLFGVQVTGDSLLQISFVSTGDGGSGPGNGGGGIANYYMDNVTVDAAAPVALVPVPRTLASLLAAVAALGLMRVRREHSH